MNGIETFLTTALRKQAKVNIHLVTGMTFDNVAVVDLDGGGVAVVSGRSKRPFVIAVQHIVWTALSAPSTNKRSSTKSGQVS